MTHNKIIKKKEKNYIIDITFFFIILANFASKKKFDFKFENLSLKEIQ